MPSTSTAAGVVGFEEARHIVEEHAAQVLAARSELCPTETVGLLAARGRVLAEALVADRDFPPFHRTTRDGYAVRAADVERVPARLNVIAEMKAGDWPAALGVVVQPGQAVSIMTGAPLPSGADAVVMVEHTCSVVGKSVEIQRSV